MTAGRLGAPGVEGKSMKLLRPAPGFVFLACLVAATARLCGADSPSDAAAAGAVRPPRAGEWAEYVVAFPLDPLEASLAPSSPFAPAAPDLGLAISPRLDPPVAWRARPVRLEVGRVDETGYQAFVTYEGVRRETYLPLRKPSARDADGGREKVLSAETHRLANRDLDVSVERGEGPEGWFVRLTADEVPFGLARFANENVDLLLVGYGTGKPPAFPLSPPVFSPPPGNWSVEGESDQVGP